MIKIPILTTGQDFLHSWRHFFGLHLSLLTIAILVNSPIYLKNILSVRQAVRRDMFFFVVVRPQWGQKSGRDGNPIRGKQG